MKKILALSLFFGQLLAFDVNYKTFSSDFTQSVKSLKSTISYKGNFVITHNEAFWNYTTPAEKQIFINGNQVVIVEPSLKQATYTSISDIPNLSQIFKAAKKITPTKYQAKYQKTTYFITIEKDEVKQITYKDGFDNDVSIVLSKQKRNAAVNKDIFKPKVPAKYDIVR